MKKIVPVLMIVWLAAVLPVSAEDDDIQAKLDAMQQRIDLLEAQLNQQILHNQNSELMKKWESELMEDSTADTALTAGYDRRFFIKSTDRQFKLEFDTQLQFRYSYALTDDGDKNLSREGLPSRSNNDASASDFELERARLNLKGYVLRDLNYDLTLEMDDDDENHASLLDYKLSYTFLPELGIEGGHYKAPFSKQYNTGSSASMLIDRSLATTVFNIGRGTGVGLFGDHPLAGTKIYYQAGLFGGVNESQNVPFSQNDNSPAVAARVSLPLFGATPDDFRDESDLMMHEKPVMQIGSSFAYTNDRSEDHFANGSSDSYSVLVRSGDGRSNIVEAGGEVTLLSSDVSYKYKGFSTTVEGYYQHADLDSQEVGFADDFTDIEFLSRYDLYGVNGLELDNYGWYAQAGQFIVPRVFELVSRVGGVCVDNTNDSYEYAGGWNWYLQGQDLKLSMDITYIDDLPIVSSSTNFNGIQNNSLFLLRTQLQFQF